MNALEALTFIEAQGLMRYWNRPSNGDWANVLAGFPLFAGVGERRLHKLVRSAAFAEFAAGERVLTKGENSDSLYVILGGAAKALDKTALRTLRTGDYFGELALIDGAARSATVIATEELQVMRLPRRSILRLARQQPAISLTMLKNLSRQLRRLEMDVARSA